MNESDTRLKKINPALQAAGWGVVEGSDIHTEQSAYQVAPGRIVRKAKRNPDKIDYLLTYKRNGHRSCHGRPQTGAQSARRAVPRAAGKAFFPVTAGVIRKPYPAEREDSSDEASVTPPHASAAHRDPRRQVQDSALLSARGRTAVRSFRDPGGCRIRMPGGKHPAGVCPGRFPPACRQ